VLCNSGVLVEGCAYRLHAIPDELPIGQAIKQLHIVLVCLEENNWKIRCCIFHCERYTTAEEVQPLQSGQLPQRLWYGG